MANHYDPPCWTCSKISSFEHKPIKRNNKTYTRVQNIYHNQISYRSKLCYGPHRKHSRDLNTTNKTKFEQYSPRRQIKHKLSMMYAYKCHKKGIMNLCNNNSEAPNFKFKKLMRYFHTKDPKFKTYRKSIITFFMKNFDKISQHDLISILWLLCHLYSITLTLKSINKSKQNYITKRNHLSQENIQHP